MKPREYFYDITDNEMFADKNEVAAYQRTYDCPNNKVLHLSEIVPIKWKPIWQKFSEMDFRSRLAQIAFEQLVESQLRGEE